MIKFCSMQLQIITLYKCLFYKCKVQLNKKSRPKWGSANNSFRLSLSGFGFCEQCVVCFNCLCVQLVGSMSNKCYIVVKVVT